MSEKAIALADSGSDRGYSIWRVILASAVGTMIEWYDFYIFGSLASVLALKFYPVGNDTFALIAYLATFAVGFRSPPLWRTLFRPYRRPGRPQVRLPGHAFDHGLFHVRHWSLAFLR